MDVRSARPVLRDFEHRLIGDYIEREFGIRMPPAKRVLLEGRLAKRLDACGIGSYGEYFRFITKDPAGRDEHMRFTDLVSTHETSFFREARHFDYIKDEVLPRFRRERKHRIRALSAACSSGEEAYSLGMEIGESEASEGEQAFDFMVEGFDLSRRMVDEATRGVYTSERAEKVPAGLRAKWMMRSKDPKKRLYRVVPELRARTSFHVGNILADMGLESGSYDIVFCRNVLIYFNRENQAGALDRLASLLAPGGFLFLGHSESLSGYTMALSRVSMSIYRKGGGGR
jgi:Methylase of chemotaxis methyl-accepting proteins